MKNDSCLTVSRRAAIIRQDAEENYGTLLTLGESMRRAYQVEELIDRMRWDNADFCLQRTDGTCLSITGTLTEYEHYIKLCYSDSIDNLFIDKDSRNLFIKFLFDKYSIRLNESDLLVRYKSKNINKVGDLVSYIKSLKIE